MHPPDARDRRNQNENVIDDIQDPGDDHDLDYIQAGPGLAGVVPVIRERSALEHDGNDAADAP